MVHLVSQQKRPVFLHVERSFNPFFGEQYWHATICIQRPHAVPSRYSRGRSDRCSRSNNRTPLRLSDLRWLASFRHTDTGLFHADVENASIELYRRWAGRQAFSFG
jgi:hypothetical protein